jgi:hypothetical protein
VTPIAAGRVEAGGWVALGGGCAGQGKGEGSLTGFVCRAGGSKQQGALVSCCAFNFRYPSLSLVPSLRLGTRLWRLCLLSKISILKGVGCIAS